MKNPKAIILDRDGTIIEHVPYLSDPSDVRLLPGAREALRLALDNKVKLFLHTNQSGIGRGYFEMEEAEACNKRLVELLDLGEEPFTRVCIAPEAPGVTSIYRKPSPAFALEVMRDFGFASEEICYIGDRGSDLMTAKVAGTGGIGVATGLDDIKAELEALGLEKSFPVFDSLRGAIRYLFQEP